MNINEDWNRKFLLKANNLYPKLKTENTNPFGKMHFVRYIANNQQDIDYQNEQ